MFLALTGGALVLLTLADKTLTASMGSMPYEVSCLTVAPLPEPASGAGEAVLPTAAKLAAVGLWTDATVRIVALVRRRVHAPVPL